MRSRFFARQIAELCAARGISSRRLAEVLYLDAKDAHAILASGKASGEEWLAVLDAFGGRAA